MEIARPPAYRAVHYDLVSSTQDLAAQAVRRGESIAYVRARHQASGRGRFGRVWESSPGESLLFSWVAWPQADHASPYLLGMAWAIAVAVAVDGELQWPNDVVLGGKKVAGLLVEIVPDARARRIAVVGVGVNVAQERVPEWIAHRATSLRLHTGREHRPDAVLGRITEELLRVPEPQDWEAIRQAWTERDVTPGKTFRLPDGTTGTALGLTAGGLLEVQIDGERRVVAAGEAMFGATEDR